MAIKQWPAIMGAEAKAKHLWDSYGLPELWKFLAAKCNLQHCILTVQLPRLNPKLNFSIIQLVDIETIHNTLVLPVENRWAIFLKNDSTWEPVSLSDYENQRGKWLCPQTT